MSIGEAHTTITAWDVCRFLRAVGNNGMLDGRRVLNADTARKIQAAIARYPASGSGR